MSWNLKGSYVETCSCELMCPCNLSFDHGATYDFCRATLVFDIREGEVDGTDIGGLRIAAIIDTPKVMTEGNWRLGVFVDDQATDEQADKLVQVFTGQLGGPMAGIVPLVGEVLGRASTHRGARRWGASQRPHRGRDRLRGRGHRPVRCQDGRTGSILRRVSLRGLRPDDGRDEAFSDQCLRHRIRGQDRALDVRVLLGRLSE
jgi:hypothetical protein